MDEQIGTLATAGMVILRIGVPLALTAGAVYTFRQLDVRWQAQDWKHWSKRLRETGGQAGQDWLARLARPCWDENGCEDSAVAKCAAHAHQNMPCWMARRACQGALPEKCTKCERYTMGALVTAS